MHYMMWYHQLFHVCSFILHAVHTNPNLRGYLYNSINVVLVHLGLSEEDLDLLLFGEHYCTDCYNKTIDTSLNFW